MLENELYASAWGFYQGGKYEKALPFFKMLTVINPKSFKYWMGLGANYYMQDAFKQALEAFSIAAVLDQNSPNPHLHAADCFLALNKQSEAKLALQSAKELAKNQPFIDKELQNRINLYANQPSIS